MDKCGDSKLIYIWDENLLAQCDRLPPVLGRGSLIHDLINAYGILKKFQVVRSTPASETDLQLFHSVSYLDHLKTINNADGDEDYVPTSLDLKYGLGYDCEPTSNMFEVVTTIAGASLTAAKSLVLGFADVAINWCGGWHHAQRGNAEGFCYVNDIVLAIETLQKKYKQILYIDLDHHHGDAVQEAYSKSNTVFTLSIHKFEAGFYPGTGSLDEIGTGSGTGYSCNVPLKASYTDDTLEFVFENVFATVYSVFAPDAVVVQCGADALAHDPLGRGGLTARGYCSCVRKVLDKRKPTLLLGGGGYSHSNTARLWTSLTALVAEMTLDNNIPEHEQFLRYGPDYVLTIDSALAKDQNTADYLNECIATISANLAKHIKNKVVENENKQDLKRRCINQENLHADGTSMRTKMNSLLKQTASKVESADVYEFNDD